MIVIAESGSTKTEWWISENDQVICTTGINPFYLSEVQIEEILYSPLIDRIENIDQLFYFGAGISNSTHADLLKRCLKKRFPTAKNIEVRSDMEAAVWALTNQEASHIGILGTGSNSIFFDGEKIHQVFPSLGYLLGDEGSGARIGQLLINALAHHELGKELHTTFVKRYNMSIEEIKSKLYQDPKPSAFLASFAPFALQHIENEVIRKKVEGNFRAFFEKRIVPISDYSKYPLHLSGSIAYFFREILQELAREYQLTLGHIVQRPGSLLPSFIMKNKKFQ